MTSPRTSANTYPPQQDPFLNLLEAPLARLAEGFRDLPPFVSPLDQATDRDAMALVLDEVAGRMVNNYPYFHPLYAGQMLKPPHPVARAAYALAMAINPNNHARDGGRASSQMEIEAVAQIAQMFGWSGAGYLGHLTSGGTFANLEALWIAGQLAPGKRILASEQAHYTHKRITAVLQLPFTSIACDLRGCMDLNTLEEELKRGDVGTVVVTMGSTALGSVDPLPGILALRSRYEFRIHLDAAYGGYFRLIAEELDAPARSAYLAMDQADSIVVDPHKHGLQPYGCGCVLFRDPSVGRFYKHDSPYTYFTSSELHLGEISLECSRAGASAVALWATQRLLPLTPDGEFARGLSAGRSAALELHHRLRNDSRFDPFSEAPQLDIVVWQMRAGSAAQSSSLAQQVFDECAVQNLHLALVQLPEAMFRDHGANENVEIDAMDTSSMVTCLRSVLMKPEHAQWLGSIWERLSLATNKCVHL
ncbi:pyridoxal phosphate-dependent decarboxylase family protein [Acidicapsa ligni]|uniref:pyridoxal phosphate-dependent decarboxylase family protein n=1 Tax=Acidicapsa ligni TaxID=542300 RepID=UPI0021E063F0|nr:aminotransferase class I/II-fold pyridoxal phosphate-dependent enzyme [Acidicapsa ligni]